jgi:hypothetical protein
LGVAVTAAAYFWTLSTFGPGTATPRPQSLYGYLTEALLSGQLHFQVEPDPRLLQLTDPYAGNQGIPRLHDATLFHGRYYIYFGVTPVAVLFAPWKLLAGSYLRDGTAIVLFAFAGFVAATGLWVCGARRYFPGLAPAWLALGIVMLGFGNYSFFLIQTPDVYQVPIACAYACLMAALGLLALAAAARRLRARAAALAGAGLAWALAVGARPDYVLGLPALALAAGLLWRDARKRGAGRGNPWMLPLACFTPLLAVGGLLAAYNYARFGSIFETGWKYQLAAVDQRGVAPASLAYVPSGLRAFLLTPAHYSLYFPFVSSPGDAFGILFLAPFAVVCAGYPLTLRDPILGRDPAWRAVGGAAFLAVALHFAAICFFWWRADRYVLDVLPAAVLLGLLVAGRAWAARRWPGAILAALAAATLLQSVFVALALHPGRLPNLARALDTPVAAAERLLGVPEGPVEMTVLFPPPFTGPSEPLVATGNGADLIYLRHPDPAHVQFGFYHRGSGGPVSRLIPIDPDRPHALLIDLGSLYPPASHPLFAGWPSAKIEALRRRLLVRMDGAAVLQTAAPFYPSDPLQTFIGRNPYDDNVPRPVFGGRILALKRRGLPSPSEIAPVWSGGPVRLALRFPAFHASYGEPLLSTGHPGSGDLVYVTYLGSGRVRFGHDSTGNGAVETATLACDSAAEHILDIDLGSLHAAASAGEPAPFRLRFDGRLLISTLRPFHPASPVETAFGLNAAGSSAAAGSFSGPKLEAAALEALPGPPPVRAGEGPVRLLVRFPTSRTGAREPLLTTGVPGAGDVVYVAYESGSQIRFGHDHWGVGGPLSEPVGLDLNEVHEVTIAASPRLRVWLDHVLVLDSPVRPYDAAAGQIFPAGNPIGASTCEARFTGTLLLAEPAADAE